ncbi:MAG: DUF5624 domain-containing protein [Actinomycetota bacterium]|nr:DUF5624 domain-containing protein [Actinomycetota bacterium]
MSTPGSAELIELFTTYTAAPASIGAHLAETVVRESARDPLLVATGTDLALFPGDGSAPAVEPYRLSNRGFKELAAVSHLGPALATLARMRELDPAGGWRADAERLLDACKAARAANSAALWRDHIAVRAFAGREHPIAAMVDYSCRLTERRLERALDDPPAFTMATVRRDYLDGPAGDLPVPFNRVMIATFFLTGMDLAHRLIGWFDALDIAWERAMVIIAGKAGRPTAGVTEESNSVAGVVRAASRGRMVRERLFIAPHAPVFETGANLAAVAALEGGYRRLWASLRATSELGGQMFEGYPRFEARSEEHVSVGAGSISVHEKPAVDGPGDWFALITRLRVVMEDPRQLLSGAVTDYASSQLVRHANDPSAVTVPGLDGEPYPHPNGESNDE